jgi:putative DNA primase/helicase
VFTSGDDLCGVDLDRCRDPETGEIESWAQEIIEELDSYAEISPSWRGVHVLLRGELPPGRRRKNRIEMYDRARFFTITGHRLQDVPATINRRQEELAQLHRQVFGLEKPTRTSKPEGKAAAGMMLADSELIDHAMRAANGEKFARLWAGDMSEYATAGNEGRSEADLALCSLLAFWCGPDEDRIDKLFRQSGLMRQKWERSDYRALTLAVALDRDEFYESGATLALGMIYTRRRGVVSIG